MKTNKTNKIKLNKRYTKIIGKAYIKELKRIKETKLTKIK